MKKQFLSIGAFVNNTDTLDTLLARQGVLKFGFRVTSIFGTFPNVIWNGGRTLIHNFSNLDPERREWWLYKSRLWYTPLGMEELVRTYNDRGIGVRYTYSNGLITKKHLGDERANLTLEIAHNPLNAVITANPVIEQYVRKHYPKFKIVSSATADKNLSVPFLKKRIDEVDLLVLPPEFNDRYDFIEKLGPEKLEVLINERCVYFCKNRAAHYRSISKSQLAFDNFCQCRNYYTRCPVYLAQERGEPAKTMELDEKKIRALQKLGVRNFKMAGRHLSKEQFAEEIDRLLIKKKFRMS
jgi:collagenase-like PrtC family protease